MKRILFLSACLLLSTAAQGQKGLSATQGINKLFIDQETPKSALKSFYRAEASSNGDLIRMLVLTTRPADEKFVAAIRDKKNADRALTEAIMRKFPGESTLDPTQAATAALPAVLSRIDKAVEVNDGKVATLTFEAGQGNAVKFRLVNGKWFIPVGSLISPTNEADMGRAADTIQRQVQAVRDLTADVEAGKYPNLADAIGAARQKLIDLFSRESTRPTTEPEF